MARIVLWTGQAAIARVFVASDEPSEKDLRVYLARRSADTGANIFLKKLYRSENGYFALVAIETSRYMEAVRLADEIEKHLASGPVQHTQSAESLEQQP